MHITIHFGLIHVHSHIEFICYTYRISYYPEGVKNNYEYFSMTSCSLILLYVIDGANGTEAISCRTN